MPKRARSWLFCSFEFVPKVKIWVNLLSLTSNHPIHVKWLFWFDTLLLKVIIISWCQKISDCGKISVSQTHLKASSVLSEFTWWNSKVRLLCFLKRIAPWLLGLWVVKKFPKNKIKCYLTPLLFKGAPGYIEMFVGYIIWKTNHQNIEEF